MICRIFSEICSSDSFGSSKFHLAHNILHTNRCYKSISAVFFKPYRNHIICNTNSQIIITLSHQAFVVWQASCVLKETWLIKPNTVDHFSNIFTLCQSSVALGNIGKMPALAIFSDTLIWQVLGEAHFLSELFSSLSKLLRILVCLLWIWHL